MNHPYEAVVIGASAGALHALSEVLSTLPGEFTLPILVVVHIPPDKESMMVPLLQAKCRRVVKEAEDKETICADTVYFAPPDYHLLVEPDKRLSLSSEEPVLFSRPSIDVLFETASDTYGPALIGVILTGANHDGAKGLKSLAEAGGLALVQQPSSAYATAMPLAALELCPEARVVSLEHIADYLQKAVSP